MPVTPVEVTAESCFNSARVYLNDQNIQLWDDQILMPMMYIAHLELQQKMKSRAFPVMKAYANIVVNPFETELIDQPPDLTSPIQIWERPLGSSVKFQPMTESEALPLLDPTNTLTYWSWTQDIVMFVGAALATDIILFYWRRIPVPTTGTDLIGIIDGDQYLSPRIAAIAAGSVGEEATSSVCTALAEAQLQFVLSANRSRAPQNIGLAIHP